MAEIRTSYIGNPLRAWMEIELLTQHDEVTSINILVDTACPMPLVLDSDLFLKHRLMPGRSRQTNYGILHGGWFRINIPALSERQLILAYESEQMIELARRSHASFAGIVGFPLLRLAEYGGNSQEFWFRNTDITKQGINP